MSIDKELYNEINEYCKLNCLKTRDFIHKILHEGFLKEKYGETPFSNVKKNTKTEVDSASVNKDKTPEETEIKTTIITESQNIDTISYDEQNVISDSVIQNENITSTKESDDFKPQPKKKRKLY